VFILSRLQADNIRESILLMALRSTAEKRGTLAIAQDYAAVLDEIRADPQMNKQWLRYQSEYPYAAGISFEETCKAVTETLERSGIHRF